MRTKQADFLEDRCPCGALLDHGMKRCRKCRARSRWYRHKACRRQSFNAGRHGAGTAPGGWRGRP
jgi:hypothetical protein